MAINSNIPAGSAEIAAAPPVPWTEPHPEIPYLPKPVPVPADRLIPHHPVCPGVSVEAGTLLYYLYTISRRQTLTGQHNFPDRRDYSTEWAKIVTGKVPALYGSDWGFAKPGDKDSAFVRDELVQKLIDEWRQGSIITLCWHAVPPTKDEPVTFSGDIQSRLTDAEFEALLTPGTEIYERWCVQVDTIAEYLKLLQAACVPVLWRPYHEINGDWFWWNGYRGDAAHGSKQLYRQLYDRYVNVHGLNNLLWVWNPDRPSRADRQFVDYFPGLDVIDVLALDCYAAYEQSYYDDLNALSGGKVLAIGETFNPPLLETYQTQPKWAYYMIWAVDSPLDGGTPPEEIAVKPDLQAMVSDARMIDRANPSYQETISVIRSDGKTRA